MSRPAPALLRIPIRSVSSRNVSTRQRRCFGRQRKRSGLPAIGGLDARTNPPRKAERVAATRIGASRRPGASSGRRVGNEYLKNEVIVRRVGHVYEGPHPPRFARPPSHFGGGMIDRPRPE